MKKKVITSSTYVPLYIQVYHLLRDAIESGEYKPGDRLPSENELIEQHNISRTTAIAALDELAKKRLVYRVRGKGTFVAIPVVSDFSFHKSFSEVMRERGLVPSSKILSLEEHALDPLVIKKLKIDTKKEFFRLVRIRCAEQEPVALQYAYLPKSLVPDLPNQDFENSHLFKILKDVYQINPAWAEAVVEAAAVDEPEAKHLNIAPGTPVLVVWHKTLDDKYQPIEYVKSVYRSDRFSFSTGRSPLSTDIT